MTKGSVLAAFFAAIAFIFISQTASAQYPPPNGSLICTIVQSRVDIYSNVTLTVRLVDTSGNARAGQRVDFVITRNTGLASLSNASGITDVYGQISTTVYVGALAGIIEIAATAPGVGCRALIDPVAPSPTPTVTPPPSATRTPVPVVIRQSSGFSGQPITGQVAGVYIAPPQTGDAGLKDPSKHGGSTVVFAVIALELIAMACWVAAGRMQVVPTKK